LILITCLQEFDIHYPDLCLNTLQIKRHFKKYLEKKRKKSHVILIFVLKIMNIFLICNWKKRKNNNDKKRKKPSAINSIKIDIKCL